MFAAGMAVPKAAMNENRGTQLREDYVRFAGEVGPVQAKPIAHTMERGPDGMFRLGVRALHARHDGAPHLLGEYVGQGYVYSSPFSAASSSSWVRSKAAGIRFFASASSRLA